MATWKHRRAALLATAAVAVMAAAVALSLFQPWRLFTDRVVDEALPGAVPISTTSSSTTPPTLSVATSRSTDPSTSPSTSPSPSPSAGTSPAPTNTATELVRLRSGRLVSHEHETTGTVAVLRLPDGSLVLRLENLDTSDGPDLKVWLSDAPVIAGRPGWHVFDDGRYHSLGRLKANHGNQNYPVPAGVELGDFRSVAIWCDRFNVSFGAAELKSA